jgi:branched-chain amino acid transport system substrate-binding protein
VTDKAPDLAKRWNMLLLPGHGRRICRGLVAMLEKAKKDGKINHKIAMINIADGFGVELANAWRARPPSSMASSWSTTRAIRSARRT